MNIFFTSIDKSIKEIAAYNTNGLLLGASKVLDNYKDIGRFAELIVSQDNPLTKKIDGFLENENIVFKAWDGFKERTVYPGIIGDGKLKSEQMGTLFLKVDKNSFEVNIPKSYSLFNNYPNPFNPTTIIKYHIPEAGNVTLKIYDLLGREIKTLVDSYKNAGTYSVNFDASNLSSGVYFYQLITSKGVFTKKMMLAK